VTSLDILATEEKVALWIVIFMLMMILDWVWVKYNQATVTGQAWRAGLLAMAIYALGALGVIAYTENPMLLVPACSGAFLGTFLATRQTKAA
jgi:hypothetical protein